MLDDDYKLQQHNMLEDDYRLQQQHNMLKNMDYNNILCWMMIINYNQHNMLEVVM